jgi:DNA-binding response OmpR family regulator
VRAALRRGETPLEPATLLRGGDLVLDRAAHSVNIGEKEANLTSLEFDLLELLMATPGRVFSRTELVDRLYESGFTGLESTLNVHIRNLRLKIEPDPAAPRYLETVFGVGYRMKNQERP